MRGYKKINGWGGILRGLAIRTCTNRVVRLGHDKKLVHVIPLARYPLVSVDGAESTGGLRYLREKRVVLSGRRFASWADAAVPATPATQHLPDPPPLPKLSFSLSQIQTLCPATQIPTPSPLISVLYIY